MGEMEARPDLLSDVVIFDIEPNKLCGLPSAEMRFRLEATGLDVEMTYGAIILNQKDCEVEPGIAFKCDEVHASMKKAGGIHALIYWSYLDSIDYPETLMRWARETSNRNTVKACTLTVMTFWKALLDLADKFQSLDRLPLIESMEWKTR